MLLPSLSNEGLLAFGRIQVSNAAPAPVALSTSPVATLEHLVEAIIPTDERSPGAKEARVADYIDLLLSESDDEVTPVDRWSGRSRPRGDCEVWSTVPRVSPASRYRARGDQRQGTRA